MSTENKIKVRALVADDLTYLPLSIIETMQCMDNVDGELANVNKLKNDLSIKVVTFTGREFTVSMQYMKNNMSISNDISLNKLWVDIAEQWIEIINARGK